MDPTTDEEANKLTRKQERRNQFLAVLMMLAYVVIVVTSAQLSNVAFLDKSVKFKAPFLFTEIKIAFRMFAFPLYLLINTLVKLIRGRRLDIRRTLRRAKAACTEDGLSWKNYVWKFGPPAVINVILQSTYTLTTSTLPTAAAIALISIAVEVSYIFSWLILGKKPLLIKSVFVAISFAGMALIAYASFADAAAGGLPSSSIYIGVSCGLVSSVLLALYQISFKRSFPKADLGQTAFIVSVLNMIQALILLPVPIILRFVAQDFEVYNIAEMPYGILLASWSGFSVSIIVYSYGLVLSSGFIMSIAELVTLVGHTVIDSVVRGFDIGVYQIAGTCLIGVAFVVMVLPDNLVSVRLRRRRRSNTLAATDSTIQFANDDVDPWKKTDDDSIVSTSENVLPIKADLDLDDSLDSVDIIEPGHRLEKF